MPVTLDPMNALALQPWFEASEAEYVADLLRAGRTPEQARAKARSFEEDFPGGAPAPGHHVFDVLHDGEPVGFVWIGPQTTGRSDEWWLWDVAIDERHRGRGFGRAAVELAEAEARRHGARSLGLKVFGFNAAARALYESLGFATVQLEMTKTLEQPGGWEAAGSRA